MLEVIENQILTCTDKSLRTKRWTQVGIHESLTGVHNRLSPATYDYFFELNPSFVYQYNSLENMAEYPVIMVRDGFLGLAFLFMKYLKPLSYMETVLLIPKKFSALVPKYWENNVLFYNVEYTPPKEDIRKVYLYGSPTIDNFINKSVPERLEEINKLIPYNAEVFILSTIKHHFLFDFRNEIDNETNFRKEVYRKLGFDVKFVDEYNVDRYQSVGASDAFINIDADNFLIYDHFFNHFFSSRGARNLCAERLEASKVLKRIRLSLFHELTIEGPDSRAFSYDTVRERINLKFNGIPTVYNHLKFYEYVKDIFKSNHAEFFL